MNIEKKEDQNKSSPLPWPLAILINLFFIIAAILIIFGLIKLVKFF